MSQLEHARHGRPGRAAAAVAVGCATAALLALLLAGVAEESTASAPAAGTTAWWATAVVLLAQCSALLRVWSRPRTVLVVVALAAPLVALVGGEDATSTTSLAIVTAVAIAVVSARTDRPVAALTPTLAVVAAAMVAGGAVAATGSGTPPGEALLAAVAQAVGTLGLVLLAASWVRATRETRRAVSARREAQAREQDALLAAAVARERTDMARELHDIAAHHLSGIAVLAGAVERQIDTDPDGAKQAVRLVRRQSTTVLRDLRSLVGLLREHDPAAATRPETLRGVRDLVAQVAATGVDVDLAVLEADDGADGGAGDGAGDPGRDVGPLAQLAAYRAVQEALANAARHAPGARCHVTVDARPAESVVVTVRNEPPPRPPAGPADGPGDGGGFGLIGMRERAQLTNAALETGPTDDGGWAVTMRLPKEPQGPQDPQEKEAGTP
ncbi:sensor histidine kinase [Nocardioides sp. zg-579]|uniref:histidine kinase n=1 Tax=Nocardioides marmotae TaxID=2663857 RepID=A0A6I3JAQ0_9ACTN|nr:histidine kinase [Nocardioides marmotae]MCR6031546.1 sensor histidine kinase [Gordonia jinghuaiqii]MTB95185.1 sensor histidine kinase [Nocardioides marmotae]QKE02331.1 sensor histidine kinase [Nocardioides marmotae]